METIEIKREYWGFKEQILQHIVLLDNTWIMRLRKKDEFLLSCPELEQKAVAKVINSWFIPFEQIIGEFAAKNHWCGSYVELHNMMLDLYGESFNEKQRVVVIMFALVVDQGERLVTSSEVLVNQYKPMIDHVLEEM